MRFVPFVIVASALLAAAVWGQPTTHPATAPLDSRPASILVAPMSPPDNGQLPWLGQSLARDLADAIGSASRARVGMYSGRPFRDANEARRAAEARGDSVVIFGDTEFASGEVRVTGQVLDASTGATLGALNATAPVTNLFPLEDQLAGQILSSVPRQWLNAPPATAPANDYASASGPEYQSYLYPDYAGYPPDTAAPYDYYSYPRTYYDYTYAYPSWWYEPYFWYGPVYYYGYWHHHHWDGDHDWDDHFGRPWRHGSIGPRFGGSRYGPRGPTPGHIGGTGHSDAGHMR